MSLIPARWQTGDNAPLGTGVTRTVTALALLIPPLAVLAPKGLTWVALALALALTGHDIATRAVVPHWPRRLALILLALVAWSGLSALWAVRADETLSQLTALAAFAIGALALIGAGRMMTPTHRRTLARALTLGLFIAFALLLIERLFEAPILGAAKDLSKLKGDELYSIYNRGLGICAILIWPAALTLWRAERRAGAATLPIVLIALAAALGAWSVLIGIGAALIGAATVLAGPRFVPRVLGGIAVIVVLAQPFFANWAIDRFAPANRAAISDNISINHRIIIWEFVSDRIIDRPLAGYGFNASRSLPGGQRKVELLLAPPKDASGKIAGPPLGAVLSVHPHNAPLQWWLELGLPGAALGAMLLLLLYGRAGAYSSRLGRAMACAQITAGACISALAWGAWQTWWLAGLVLAAWFTLVITEADDADPARP